MKNISRVLTTTGLALGLCLLTANVGAQGGFGGGGPGGGGGGGRGGGGMRNMDPTQMMQAAVDNLRDQLEVTDDAEWKVLSGPVQKVLEAQIAMGSGTFNLMALAFGRGGRGGGGPGGNANNNRRGGGAPFGLGAQSPEEQALQRAIDLKASPTELKTAITRVAESRKKKQDNLDKARADLAALLSARQEAICYSLGLL